MTVLALVVAGLLILWMATTYVNLPGFAPFLPTAYAAAYSLEVALVGVIGALVGVVAGSAPVALAWGLVALVAAIPVVRIWSLPEALTGAFGPAPSLGYMLGRRWGLRLRAVPAARVDWNVPFWTPPGEQKPLLCDLWHPPQGVAPSGLGFVYVHGAAWAVWDKDAGTRPFFSHLAAQGHVVMDVANRLYPETDMEGMQGDVRRAIAWLKEHAAEYGVDPDRIVVGGGSSGGHLALLVAYTAGHPTLTPPDVRSADTSVSGVVSWYGPVDLPSAWVHFHGDVLRATQPDKPDWNAPLPPLMRRLMGKGSERLRLSKLAGVGRLDWMLGGTPDEVPGRYALLSPITHARAVCPPTLLMQGPRDIIAPIASTRELHRKLVDAGVKVALLEVPLVNHAFDLFGTNWSPSARVALWHTERFLAWVAARPAVARPAAAA